MQPALATTNPNPQPNKTNHPSFEDLLATAKVLGDQAGKGKDTQIKFALLLIDGAYMGTLSLDPNKHGTARDDATVMSEAYVRAQQGAVIFDAKADKSRKLVSTTRKCIKLGSNPKWGRGQPMQAVQELVEHRQKLRKDPATAKKLDDAFNMLMRYATVQIKNDHLLPDDQRNAFAFKPVSDEKTEIEKLEVIRKALDKTGDTSPQIVAARHSITQRIVVLTKAGK